MLKPPNQTKWNMPPVEAKMSDFLIQSADACRFGARMHDIAIGVGMKWDGMDGYEATPEQSAAFEVRMAREFPHGG